MIRHCVFVKFRSDVDQAARDAIFVEVAALKDAVEGMVNCHIGSNVSPEGLGRGFAHGFTMDFKDAAARDAYLVAPVHKAAAINLVAALEGGADGVMVFDLEV
ncbi:Dabb family protein [Devosia rhodophyticola]|uniref:Dabb family protein n=1 Tax=Devosia rhodophyticola TaxID=3026423 RepID=A0ABY7YXI4_9HYPH|nr:Dabb family protein [Devosia rhodophyticola]WDR06098.1 Dabb family protein [Devosia rhodophyticola]